jgi:AAA domain, putative AbiEii toxin, Type IV TA system
VNTLKQLKITNFRRFQNFSVRLGPGNILVGRNNSGKSSILDAFRVLEACLRNTKTRGPTILEIANRGVFDGYEITESVLPFSLANITHNYNNSDAVLEFHHSNGARAVILLHPDRLTRFFIETLGPRLTKSQKFRNAFPVDLVIIPTLAPLEADESLVEEATQQRNSTTRLASRVFRNFWRRQSEAEFDDFRKDIEAAWPTIKIKKPELTHDHPRMVQMYYSEERIDREIQWSGFGFQVWMLMHTHFRRGNSQSILIIDEPDIYLHPDLQRKLLRIIREKFGQFVLATHAVEIINEADSNELISVNSKFQSGKRINSEVEFSALYQYIGSASNADFARIARAKKVIFVEGKDARILRRLGSKFGFLHIPDSQNVPIIQLGGFSEWKKAAHAVWAFKNILGIEVESFCLFDRDYRTQRDIEEFLCDAKKDNLICRVLARKEIENYLIDAESLYRAISKKQKSAEKGVKNLTLEELVGLLDVVTTEMRDLVSSQCLANALLNAKKNNAGEDQSTIIQKEMKRFESEWKDLSKRIFVVPGKSVLSELNGRLIELGVGSVTSAMIVDQMDISGNYGDLKGILSDIDHFCG